MNQMMSAQLSEFNGSRANDQLVHLSRSLAWHIINNARYIKNFTKEVQKDCVQQKNIFPLRFTDLPNVYTTAAPFFPTPPEEHFFLVSAGPFLKYVSLACGPE